MSDEPQNLSETASSLATSIEGIASDVATATRVISKANLWTAVIGFFTALPGIVRLIQSFMTWVNTVSGNNPQAFVSNLGDVFAQLSTAKTKEDRENAAKNMADLIRKLHS